MKLDPVPAGGGVQRELARLEADARHLRYFLPTIPTGLIQTPAYMRQVMGRVAARLERDTSRLVELKLERQAVLRDGGKRFDFVLTESAIRWMICEGSVMARQLEHLVSLSQLPHVDIRVLLLSARVSDVPFNTFTVYDDSAVTLEVFTGRVVLHEPEDVGHYGKLFEYFAGQALAGDEARQQLLVWARGFKAGE